MKIIVLFLIAYLLVGTSFGGDSTKTTPSVITIYPSFITDKRANICALITSKDSSVISQGFAVKRIESVGGPSTLEYDWKYDGHDVNYCMVLRLYPGFSYTVRAFICTRKGTIYGNPVFFTTKP